MASVVNSLTRVASIRTWLVTSRSSCRQTSGWARHGFEKNGRGHFCDRRVGDRQNAGRSRLAVNGGEFAEKCAGVDVAEE